MQMASRKQPPERKYDSILGIVETVEPHELQTRWPTQMLGMMYVNPDFFLKCVEITDWLHPTMVLIICYLWLKQINYFLKCPSI